MSGKNREDTNDHDPEAAFFGDDVDWLDDDDDEVIERRSPPGASASGAPPPGAPAPPVPPALRRASLVPKDQARAEWERRNLPYGDRLSTVETLVERPWDGGPGLGDFDTVEIPQEPGLLSEDDLPTAQVPVEERQAVMERARAQAAQEEPTEEVPATILEEDEEVPLVRTKEPAPIRMEIPDRDDRARTPGPGFSWSPPSKPNIPAFLVGGENVSRMMTATLITEASVAEGTEAGVLQFRVGWVFRHRLGDLAGAENFYRKALDAGCRDPILYRELAEVYVDLQRWEEAAVVLHERAALLDGVPAAESLRACAEIHLEELQNPSEGVARLWDSLEANPDDYASLVLLRDFLSDVQPERAEVLARIAGLTAGPVAADAWCERGRLLRSTDPAGAVDSYRRALEAQPGHIGAFADLELACADEPAARAALYVDEASQDPSSAGWWWWLAARDYVRAGMHEDADRAYRRAVGEGWTFAAEEQTARLLAERAWGPLVEVLERSAPAGEAGAPVWFRIGWIRERYLGDLTGALAAYRRAIQEAPDAIPVQDAIRRTLRRLGATDELYQILTAHVGQVDADRRAWLLFRTAEVAENNGDVALARDAYAAAVDHDPHHFAAWTGLARMLRHLGESERLLDACRRWADKQEDPALKSHILYLAALGRPAVDDAAVPLLEEALREQPGNLAALDLYGGQAHTPERRARFAEMLDGAANVVKLAELRAYLYYSAAKLHLEREGGLEKARWSLERCLVVHPGFEAARVLAFDLAVEAGDLDGVCRTYRERAEASNDPAARGWLLFASAVMADPESSSVRTALEAVLAHQPDHEAARRLLAEVCQATGDFGSLVASYRQLLLGPPSLHSTRVSVRLAQIYIEQGRTEDAAEVLSDLASINVEGRPLRPAVRLARHAAGIRAETALLEAIDTPWAKVERASLLARRRRDRDTARALALDVLSTDPSHVGAALVLARIGALTEDVRLLGRARQVLAHHGGGEAARFANAMWAAVGCEKIDATDRARELFELAAALRPSSEMAALGVLRARIRDRDAEGVRALLERSDLDPMAVGLGLVQVGDRRAAAEAFRRAAEEVPALPALLELEQVLEELEEWEALYRVLEERRERTRDASLKDAVEQRIRWVLAEKLPTTEEAWTTFQALHEQHPDDRAITEAYARIAGAQRKTEAAIALLTELAEGASSAEEAARYMRRVAEARRAAGDRAAARQAYLDALDHHPGDREAIAGLKALAEEEEDWAGLVQILQREAALLPEEEQVEALRTIARIHQHRLSRPAVAIEAWGAVLDRSPQDLEALDQLMELTRAEGEWARFVEFAKLRAALSSGAMRTGLLREIGIVCYEHLHRDDALRHLVQAIQEEPPDLEAARRLEAIHEQNQDWRGYVQALEAQSRAAPTDAEKIEALKKIAAHALRHKHDRDAVAAAYRRILEIDPHHEEALRFMASHLFEAGRFDEALPVCQRLEPVVERGQDLDDFDTRIELAQFYFYFAEMLRLAGEDGALERYERALELNNTHLPSLEAVGPLLCEAGKWQKAEEVYRRLLQLFGSQGERHKVATIYTQLGLVERALGRTEKAAKRFQKALDIYPNHVGALKGKAKLLEDREEWTQLLTIYNNIIYQATVHEDVIDAYMTKAWILDDHMRRPDKAAQHYERCVDFRPDQPLAYLALAELALREGDYKKAGEWAAKGLQLDGEDADRVRHLLLLVRAATHLAEGKRELAEGLYRKARQATNGADLPDGLLDDPNRLREYVRAERPRR